MCKKILMLLMAAALTAYVSAATTFIGPGTDWQTAGNWDAGVPTAADFAYIIDAHAVLAGAGAEGGMDMTGLSGELAITGSLASNGRIMVGTLNGQGNTMTLSGGASLVINPGDLYMAMDTGVPSPITATVNVTGGSTVETDAIILGSWTSCPGATAIINIDGAGSVVTCGIRDGEIWANAIEMAGGAGKLAGEINLIHLTNGGKLVYMSTGADIDSIARAQNYIDQGIITADGTVSMEVVPGEGDWYSIVITPEPATMMLLGLGGLALIRRKR
jgi:hypothetical protein